MPFFVCIEYIDSFSYSVVLTDFNTLTEQVLPVSHLGPRITFMHTKKKCPNLTQKVSKVMSPVLTHLC